MTKEQEADFNEATRQAMLQLYKFSSEEVARSIVNGGVILDYIGNIQKIYEVLRRHKELKHQRTAHQQSDSS